jgi:ribosomal protein L12E/L44/L45/RPP1/RPP2
MILGSVGIEVNQEILDTFFNKIRGRTIPDLIAIGESMLNRALNGVVEPAVPHTPAFQT